jgi:hypothetical protein
MRLISYLEIEKKRDSVGEVKKNKKKEERVNQSSIISSPTTNHIVICLKKRRRKNMFKKKIHYSQSPKSILNLIRNCKNGKLIQLPVGEEYSPSIGWNTF